MHKYELLTVLTDAVVYDSILCFFSILNTFFAINNTGSMRWKQYTPIIKKAPKWPIVQLHKQHTTFIQTVINQSLQTLLAQYPHPKSLTNLLERTVEKERKRLQTTPWRIDPPDEAIFWEQIAADLATDEKSRILEKIILRYVHEIAVDFNIIHHQLAQGVSTYLFAKLLKPARLFTSYPLARIRTRLQKNIQIIGEIQQLRKLAQIGTLVMVPTHLSHIDSMLIFWMLHSLGLPPFIYGAGLNLCNNLVFNFFIKKVGTYKIDRRKRHILYITTLKIYASLALQWGCHSLFYPGGTRSRSGAIETTLHLRLLEATLEAQQKNYENQGRNAPKIFIIPIALSYHCVLEAPLLIKQYLPHYLPGISTQQQEPSKFYQSMKLIQNFLTKSSQITIAIGPPLDTLGNNVDEAGHSYSPTGERIDLYPYFCSTDRPKGPDNNPLQMLSKAIIRTYYSINCVFASHLIAFTAFLLLQKQYAEDDLATLFQLPQTTLVIPYAAVEHTFTQLRQAIIQLQQAYKIQVADHLQTGTIPAMIQYGVDNLGTYHVKKPLVQNKTGDFITHDLATLFYYHNRLTGYGLEKTVT